MTAMRRAGAIVVVASALSGCAKPARPPASVSRRTEPAQPQSASGVDRTRLDEAISPCDDFYLHACGGWIGATQLTPERPRVEMAMEEYARHNEAAWRSLLEDEGTSDDPELERVRAFFASCMNDTDATADATLRKWLDRIDAAKTKKDVQAVLVELHALGVDAFFTYSGQPDRTDMRRHRAEIHQGEFDAVAVDEVARLFGVLGLASDRARRDATQVRAIDAALIAAAIPFEDRFDPARSENPLSRAALARLAPHLDWKRYLDAVGHPADRPVNVTSPRYLQAVDAIVHERTVADLQAYLRWRLLFSLRAALPDGLAFGSRPKRSKQSCRDATLLGLGVELSRQFARASLGPAARERAVSAAERIRTQFARALRGASWLSESARLATIDKVERVALRIGYPDVWPATGTFPLGRDTYLDNVLAARAFERRREWDRARAERHDDAWEMIIYPNVGEGMASARLVVTSAFPDVFSNSLIMPAARLQRPWFDADAPVEIQYATFGSVLAHETVHILEFHGFAADGSMRETWTEADVAAHAARRACVVDEGDAFVAFETTHLDGAATVDENVADASGIVFAYRALAETLGADLHERGADGFTAAQRFFYAYAHQYCTAETTESARESIRDSHGPPRFRVDMPLANLPEFAASFDCSAEDAMVRSPAERCAVW